MARRRYNDYYQPEVVDPGVINFGSIQMYNPEDVYRMAQAGQAMQQRWDMSQASIAKYLEDVGAAKMRDIDSKVVLKKLNQNIEDVYSTVNKDYQGDYGKAYNTIIKNLSKSMGIMHQAQKAYEEEQKYAPLISKLAAENKLLFAPNAQGEYVDPRTKSVFNEQGEYVGGLDYSNIRERSDYDKIIEDAVVRGIDKTAVESGLTNSKTAGYLLQLQRSGLAALGNTEQEIDNKIDKIAEEYAPIFEAQTTYSIDPDRPKISSKEYIKAAIYRLASSKTGGQYIADRNYDPSVGKSSSGNGIQNNLRGLYTRVGMVSDEGDVKKNTVSSFLNKISGYDENKNLREFILAGRHVDNPTEYPTINGKLFKPYNEIIVDYWEDLAKNPVPITESSKLTPEAKAAIDNFFGSDFLTRNQTMSKETVRQVAGEVATKLRYELTREEKKYKDIWNDYKSKYKDIYDIVQKQGGTDIQFLDAVDFVEQNNKKVQYSLTSIADPEENTYVGESVLNKIPGETKLRRINPGTFDKNHAKKVDLKLNPKSFSVNFYHGIMRMEDSENGYIYEIPKEALPNDINKLMSISQNILKKAVKYGESKTPDVLPYAEPIESKFNTSGQRGYPVILYSLDENSLQNVMTKIYVEDPRKPIMDKSGNFTDNVFVNPDNTVISVPYSTTDLEDYLMHKLSITFNPYSKKQ